MRAYVKIRISGTMPERALLRLRRAEIVLRNIKKETPTALLLTVQKSDLAKIFAIYPKVCYTAYGHSSYQVQILGEIGVYKWITWAKCRLFFLLGALAFIIGQVALAEFVLGIEFVGSNTYARETLAVLEEYGIKKGSRYVAGKEDLICASLLRLKGVEFCSIQKRGLYVYVETRLNEERLQTIQSGAFTSILEGEIVSITVLSGTAVKGVGDKVAIGDTLIADYLQTSAGEREKTYAVGKVDVACVYQAVVDVVDEESAFAAAYLQANIGEKDEITGVDITPLQNGFAVKIMFTATQGFNL